ncbi:MAG TPA: hypothetical protein VGN37_18435 [Actinocatenispora sp.]
MDVDAAVADEHVRSSAYQRVVAVLAAGRSRDGDRAVVATILRDPADLTAKTAVVALVDRVATTMDDPADLRRWAAGLAPEFSRLGGHLDLVHRRVHDWAVYLTVRAGRVPDTAELACLTDWMQRRLATESTSPPVLDMLAGSGRTRKTRNLARNRAGSRAVRGR